MTLERKECPAEEAIKKMATFLDKGERPLALISDSYDRQEVAKHLKKQRLGTSLVLAGSLLAAADYEQDISLAALTYINDHYLLAKNVASMRLLVQIYSLLRNQQGGIKFPFASASSFRDVVLEIEQTGRQLPSNINGGVYEAELTFVQGIWKECMAARHSARAKRLEQYADKLKASKTPVAYLHWGEPDEQIMAFLRYAAQQGVPACEFEAKLSGEAEELDLCWSGGGKTQNQKPLAYEAQTLEEAAQASQKMLRQWLHEHKQDDDIIGIIDYDRALTRRLHSLLLQEDIFLQETRGWPANNLLVGKALLALASDASKPEELITKLQNVIVRKQGYQWGNLPRNLARGKTDLGLQQVAELERILETFIKNQDRHFKSRRSISEWFGTMAEEAETGFFQEFFEQDAAAKDLRPLLRMLADEFAELEELKEENFAVGEVRRLLFDSLSSINLNSSNNDSRVQLVPSGRFTSRKFKAMLLAGADADTLPQSRAPQLFSNEVRTQMRLPTLEEKIAKQRKSTALLLGNSCKIGAVWYGQAGISPYIDIMSEETKLLKRLDPPWEKKKREKRPLEKESRGVTLQKPPETISVSACESMLACPYKYHARHVLKLDKDAPAAIGQRNQYGTFVHEILEKFHKQLKEQVEKLGFPGREDIREQLQDILEEARSGSVSSEPKRNKMTKAERRYFAWEFQHYLDAYAAQIDRLFSKKDGEEQFKGIVEAEVELETELCLDKNTKIKITGKADRIDCYGEKHAIIDIKTGDPKKFKDYTTHPQLPLYMKLHKEGGKAIDAEHTKFWVLSLESGENKVSRVPESMPDDAPKKVFDLYKDIFTKALNEAKLLPANGVQSVCQYCEYGGLCRKKHWDTNNNKKKK